MGTVYHLPTSSRPPDSGPANGCLALHYIALQEPRGFELPIVQFRSGLMRYGIAYEERFNGDRLGGDAILGEAWLSMARAYLDLLNGETGRLDCGTLDGEVRSWAMRYGFTEEL